jgi:ABC-2 type transport system permease protein
MRKIRVIALREFLAAVRTKAFLLTILMMPILMSASIGLQVMFKKLDDAKEKVYVVIDHTPGQKLGKFLQATASVMQAFKAKDSEIAGLIGTKTSFELVPAATGGPEALAQQRFDISQKIEKGEYQALVEIGPKVADLRDLSEMFVNPDKTDDKAAVRFQAKNVGAITFRRIIEVLINQGVQMERFQQKGIAAETVAQIQQPVVVKLKALTRKDAKTGEYVDGADEAQIINLVLPGVLIAMMFMIIMIGATPAMHGVVEEKGQRIAEVLLGSVTPFQLMAGKLLGVIGVSMTMATVYLGGGFFLASYFGFADLVPLSLIAWFVPMLVLALLIFGSLFIAVGAAASDVKDTQTLLMPIMMMACLPFFAMGPIMQDPNGPIARACSFFPFATPMLLVARQSVPPGVPLWEMLAGIALVLVTTTLCVWAAGRIFRIGILSQGKTPRFIDLIKWVVKG